MADHDLSQVTKYITDNIKEKITTNIQMFYYLCYIIIK